MHRVLLVVPESNILRPDHNEAEHTARHVLQSLIELGYFAEIEFVGKDFFESANKINDLLRSSRPDLIFNLFDGLENDASCEAVFAQTLEQNSVAFTGNSSSVLGRCQNKHGVNEHLKKSGVCVPSSFIFRDAHGHGYDRVMYPAFVKPCFEDSSLGIDNFSCVSGRNELSRQIQRLLREFPSGVVVEDFIPGDEFAVGILNAKNNDIVGVSRLSYKGRTGELSYLDYSSKWDSDSSSYNSLVPVVCMDKKEKLYVKAVDTALSAAAALGCDSYLRVDMREKDGNMYVIDVNPNPSISPDSGFVRQAKAAGMDYKQLIKRIVNYAIFNGKNLQSKTA